MKKRIISFILVFGFILSSSFLSACSLNFDDSLESQPYSVKSESEIKNVIKSFKNSLNVSGNNKSIGATDDAPMSPESSQDAGFAGTETDYSSTNTQVEGVDEGDIIKNDGNYIYKLQGSGLNIYSAQNGSVTQLSTTSFSDFYPYEMFLYSTSGGANDIAVILGGVYSTAHQNGGGVSIEPMCCFYYYSTDTCVKIYNISNKSAPKLLRELTVSGNYLTSRIYDNKLYYLSNYYFNYNDESSYIPLISDSSQNGGKTKKMDVADIYYYKSAPAFNYLITGFIDLKNTAVSDKKAYLGVSGEIYFAGENFYAVSYDYSDYSYQTSIFGYSQLIEYKTKSRIIKFSSSSLKQTAITRVDGTIKDRYSLDEYDGYLRIATSVYYYKNSDVSSFQSGLYSNVYVLDAGLKQTGKIEKIAEGERIYSVRFKEEIGSLVTFRNIDPYFKIDLSDPENPKIAGELKEEGVSDYIHYIDGKSLTIGVGRSTKEITNQWGTQVTFNGLKVALYDISGANPVALVTDSTSLTSSGDYVSAYTELMYNPKALLYSQERGLFAFPVEIWSYSTPYYYYSSMKQGLAVFKFNTVNKTLIFQGLLSDMSTAANPNSYTDFYNSYWSQIRRGIQIGDYVYTVSDKYITSYSLSTLTKLNQLYTGDNDYYVYK